MLDIYLPKLKISHLTSLEEAGLEETGLEEAGWSAKGIRINLVTSPSSKTVARPATIYPNTAAKLQTDPSPRLSG